MSNPTPSDPASPESPESGAQTPAPPAAGAEPAAPKPAADATTTPSTEPAAPKPSADASPKTEQPAETATPDAKPTTPASPASPASEKPHDVAIPTAPDGPTAASETTEDKAATPTAPTTPAAEKSADGEKAAAAGRGAAAGSSKDAAKMTRAEKKAAKKDAADQKKAAKGSISIVVDRSLPPGTVVVESSEGTTVHSVEGQPADGEKKVGFWRRGPFVTVAGAVVVLVILGLLGYVWGLGPLNRLNTARGITPPAKLAGLDRITDADIRGQLQLDQTRQALSRINNGKQATVEAYGNLDGDRLFVVIALRGKVDIAKTVADSGASPDKIKKVGQATCVETTGNLPTQCYRGSNTLTVIAQSANEGITVDQVAPVAVEAFHAMK
ncbi:hypothetical protein OG474_31175 [Kribbella sp. NBC_01505]|uniref:hypothetical protein n=1 Tax=Kribbella sp. NBC_01505 TaxID=2903580 RepID=UPI00386EAC84